MNRSLKFATCSLLWGCAAKSPASVTATTATLPEGAEVRQWRGINEYIRAYGLCRGDGGGASEAGVGLHERRDAVDSDGGKLPPEVIQDIVRGNYEEFRECYEEGLRHHPDLQGRVVVRFIIDRDGRVSKADDDGSTMPDPEVVRCVVRRYSQLCFPPPEGGGIVTVVYPIMFSQRDD